MLRIIRRAAVVLTLISLVSCAQLGATEIHRAKPGMSREQAIAGIRYAETRFAMKSGAVEYLLYCVTPSFTAMYRDHPYVVYFIRLEGGKVVDRGIVDEPEAAKIRLVNPTFVLREWQSNDSTNKGAYVDR